MKPHKPYTTDDLPGIVRVIVVPLSHVLVAIFLFCAWCVMSKKGFGALVMKMKSK
jgi:hypothetical protein